MALSAYHVSIVGFHLISETFFVKDTFKIATYAVCCVPQTDKLLYQECVLRSVSV